MIARTRELLSNLPLAGPSGRAVAVQLLGQGIAGAAMLLSTALTPAERGRLAAFVLSAVLGSALGGLSADTVMPAYRSTHREVHLPSLLAAVLPLTLLSGVMAVVAVALVIGLDLPWHLLLPAGLVCTALIVLTGALLAVGRLAASLWCRLTGSSVQLVGFAVLAATDRKPAAWMLVWLAAQTITVLGMLGCLVIGRSHERAGQPPAKSASGYAQLTGTVHVGVMASFLTLRADQVILGALGKVRGLGAYSLWATVMDFALAPGAVLAQQTLSSGHVKPRRSFLLVALSALALGGLAVVAVNVLFALFAPTYLDYWYVGLILLPAAVVLAVSRPLAASLLVEHSAKAPTLVALVTLPFAILLYLAGAEVADVAGVAAASIVIYVGYTLVLGRQLRRARS